VFVCACVCVCVWSPSEKEVLEVLTFFLGKRSVYFYQCILPPAKHTHATHIPVAFRNP
jgi:hypothetical protein